MLKKNQTHICTVTDLNNLGYGVSRIEGTVVFVDGAVTGDVARIKLIKVAKDYAVARLEELLTPSPDRIEPNCAVSRACGGCSYRAITPEAERLMKQQYVMQAFRKAGMRDAEIAPVLPSPNQDGYRNKVLYPIGKDYRFGYYARHSHRIVPCTDCRLQAPVFQPILRDLEAFFDKVRPGNLRNCYLRYAEMTDQVLVCPVLTTPDAPWASEMVSMLTERYPNIKTILLNINPSEGNVVLGKETRILYGDGYLEDIVCGLRFRISPLSFYQVNRGGAELLYTEALSRAAKGNPKHVADLYCGTGTIGLIFAARMPHISLKGVEIVPSAVENAKFNAKLNGIENAEFLCADSVGAEVDGMDCVILDPPRKGSDPALLEKCAECRVPHIVYVSCNPDTLARDAALLAKLGYRMGSVNPVDLFPRTGSIECVTDFLLEEGEA